MRTPKEKKRAINKYFWHLREYIGFPSGASGDNEQNVKTKINVKSVPGEISDGKELVTANWRNSDSCYKGGELGCVVSASHSVWRVELGYLAEEISTVLKMQPGFSLLTRVE